MCFTGNWYSLGVNKPNYQKKNSDRKKRCNESVKTKSHNCHKKFCCRSSGQLSEIFEHCVHYVSGFTVYGTCIQTVFQVSCQRTKWDWFYRIGYRIFVEVIIWSLITFGRDWNETESLTLARTTYDVRSSCRQRSSSSTRTTRKLEFTMMLSLEYFFSGSFLQLGPFSFTINV